MYRPQRQKRSLYLESLEGRRLLTVVSVPASMDASIYQSIGAEFANGKGDHFFAGTTNGPDGQNLRRGLLNFDLTEHIPPGSAINEVTLTLNMSRTAPDGVDATVSLHRITEQWSEGPSNAPGEEGSGTGALPGDVTWRYREFNSDEWTQPGGDFSGLASGAQLIAGVGSYSWSSPGMIDDVQNWLDFPDENFGWLLRGNESTRKSAKRFDSRENSTPDNQPMLVVDFDSQNIPTVSIEDTSSPEGDAGLGSLEFPVTMSQAETQEVTVRYEVTEVTATADEDFVAENGELVFQPGETEKTISVFINGDTIHEMDETLEVRLVEVIGADTLRDVAVGTIEDDDPLPTVEFSEMLAIEESDDETVELTVEFQLSDPSTDEVTFNFTTADGDAIAGEDYEQSSGSVTFESMQQSATVVLRILGDEDVEPDEAFALNLSEVENATLAADAIQITIINDDEQTETPWQNIEMPLDVDGDGIVAPIDALLVINRLNSEGAGPLPIPPTAEDSPPPFLDVNGDDFVAPIDALLVINELNSPASVAAFAPTLDDLSDEMLVDEFMLADVAAAFAYQDDLTARRRRL